MLKKKAVLLWIVALVAVFHFTVSTAKMSNKFDDEPAAGPFGGIRLHYLKVVNFDFSHGVSAEDGTSHILDNFIKSAVSGTHGLLDFAHWYAYSGIYNILGIPINEFWLLLAQTTVMFSGLLLMAYLVFRLYDNIIAGLVFLIIASQLYVQHSISFYIIPANTLYEGMLLLAIFYYDWKKGSIRSQMPLLVMLLINSASGNVIKLPVYLYFAWAVAYKRDNYGLVASAREYIIKKPLNLLFAVPICFTVLAHLYVYKRIGESNLGLIGWVSQKVGLGAPMVSRFASLGNSLKSMIFSGIWDWWVFIVIAACYASSVIRGKKNAPLLLFPLVYYIYLVNLEPYSAMLPYLILVSIGITGMIKMAGDTVEKTLPRYLSTALAALFAVYVIIAPLSESVNSLAAAKKPVPNYLKSIGYYLREQMSREDKIASLLPETQNILNEYYYGKNFFKSPVFGKYIYDLRNLTTPLSPSNPVTPEEVDTEFAFYVVSAGTYANDNDYAGFVNRAIKRYSLKKVADIAEGGRVFASIYSSRPLAYKRVDVEEANRAFDKKYATLKKLFYNHHVGVASTWGFY